jgi:hypothetical protein
MLLQRLAMESYDVLYSWHLEHSDEASSFLSSPARECYFGLILELPVPAKARLEDVACLMVEQVVGVASWAAKVKVKVDGSGGEATLEDLARLGLRALMEEGMDPFLGQEVGGLQKIRL